MATKLNVGEGLSQRVPVLGTGLDFTQEMWVNLFNPGLNTVNTHFIFLTKDSVSVQQR